MSAPVDVLAVLHRELRWFSTHERQADLLAASAAVAELIAAAAELSRDLEHAMALANFEKAGTVADDHPLRVSLDALDAALARCAGGAQ